MPLPNPSFKPKTHWWCPGVGAPSREVPSQICAALGQKQPFLDQNSPKTRAKRPNEGIRWSTLHVRLGLHRVKELSSALQFHDMSEKRPKKAPKSPKNLRNAHHHPETKHRAYLGVRGSNPNSEGA